MKAIWEEDYHEKYRCLVIFIPWNIWEDQLTCLGGWNLTTTKLAILSQNYAAGRASNIKLLMLVLEFKVDYRLKYTQRYFCGMYGMSQWGCIEEKEEECDAFCASPGRENQITTSAKLLDIKHKSYGFNGDLTEAIN